MAYICCDNFKIKSYSDYRNHMKCHSRDRNGNFINFFFCPICVDEKSLGTISGFRRHLISKHREKVIKIFPENCKIADFEDKKKALKKSNFSQLILLFKKTK